MRDMYFDTPVTIEINPRGGVRTVGSVLEAAEMLMVRWPGHRGPSHAEALRACLGVLKGNSAAPDVRDTLIAAASEAGLAVRPDVDALSNDRCDKAAG